MPSRLPRLLPVFAILSAVICSSFVPPLRSDPPKAEIPSRLVTLQQKDVPLSAALQQFKMKTGVEVTLPPGEDPKISVDLKDVAFWKAIDDIAALADMHLYPYFRDGKLSLLKGRSKMPASYSGPFRITLKRVVVAHDLESDTRTTKATLELVWLPPFEGFLLQKEPHGFEVKDEKGGLLPLPHLGKGYIGVASKNAAELEVRLPSVPRGAQKLGSIKGELSVVGAAQMLTFTFNKLEKAKSQPKDGVTVEISEVNTKVAKDLWMVKFTMKYPPGGPSFDSFQAQACLVENRAVLLRNRQRLIPKGTETLETPANEAAIRYSFGDDDGGKTLGDDPAKWRVEYRTPSPLLVISVPFEFKDVELP